MATEKLTVAVLGAGNVGGTLGRKWIAARHQVVFAVSDPNGKHAQNLRGDLGNSVVIGSVADALNSNPEVVVLAVPGTVVDTLIPTYAQQLDGRIIMACYNGEATEGEAMLSPMRTLGTVLLDTFALIPYSQVATIANDPDDAPPLFLYNESGAFQAFAPHDIDALLDIAGNRASSVFQVELRQLGGTLARQPEEAMAFNCRHAHF